VCMPVRVIVCVMGAVGAVWTAPLPHGLPHPRRERLPILQSLCAEAPQRQGPPLQDSFQGWGLLTWGSMSGCLFLGLSAAECSLLLRPPSQGDLPVLVTHPVHHQQLAGVSGWLGTSLLEATCLGPHGGSRWGHHPGSRE
uniref:Uncharacterized protein n=1 Tax=Macaca nemestrina TaxID=9545 RepID=A0A2K6E888_MACNE